MRVHRNSFEAHIEKTPTILEMAVDFTTTCSYKHFEVIFYQTVLGV